jgi:hypothetical protein
MFVFK